MMMDQGVIGFFYFFFSILFRRRDSDSQGKMFSIFDQLLGGFKKANITDFQIFDQELMKIRTIGLRREKNMGGVDVFFFGSETYGV